MKHIVTVNNWTAHEGEGEKPFVVHRPDGQEFDRYETSEEAIDVVVRESVGAVTSILKQWRSGLGL